MWFPGETWQCGGCTSFTAQFVRLDFLEPYDARFVIVTPGPIDEALAYKARVGNRMDWYSTANSSVRRRRRRAARRRVRGQRVPARRRRHRLPDLAHERAGDRAARAHVPARRRAARTAGRRSGRTFPTAGRRAPPTRGGSTRSRSPRGTASRPTAPGKARRTDVRTRRRLHHLTRRLRRRRRLARLVGPPGSRVPRPGWPNTPRPTGRC